MYEFYQIIEYWKDGKWTIFCGGGKSKVILILNLEKNPKGYVGYATFYQTQSADPGHGETSLYGL